MIRIDPDVTELSKPIPWVSALTIYFAVKFGREFLADDQKCFPAEMKPKPNQ